MDRGAWQATVHKVAKSHTQLMELSTHNILDSICRVNKELKVRADTIYCLSISIIYLPVICLSSICLYLSIYLSMSLSICLSVYICFDTITNQY